MDAEAGDTICFGCRADGIDFVVAAGDEMDARHATGEVPPRVALIGENVGARMGEGYTPQ